MSIITVAARFWGRIVIHSISWDDWLMLITLVLYFPNTRREGGNRNVLC